MNDDEKNRERNYVFYASFLNALEYMPDEVQLEVYRAIARYGCRGELPEGMSAPAMAMFMLMKPQVDASASRYERSGQGGAPRGNSNNLNGRRGKTNQEPTEPTEPTQKTNQEPTSETKEPTQRTNQEPTSETKEPTKEPTKNQLNQPQEPTSNQEPTQYKEEYKEEYKEKEKYHCSRNDACARAREEFLNDFFDESRLPAVDNQCDRLGVTVEDYRELVAEVLDDWEVNGPVPKPDNETRMKMVNTVRKKHRAKQQEAVACASGGGGMVRKAVRGKPGGGELPVLPSSYFEPTEWQKERDRLNGDDYLKGEALARKLAQAPWNTPGGGDAAAVEMTEEELAMELRERLGGSA